jgi:hypothetical protein
MRTQSARHGTAHLLHLLTAEYGTKPECRVVTHDGGDRGSS